MPSAQVAVAVAVLASAAPAPTPAGGAVCTAPPGTRVVLRSNELDPNVFVWSNRTRAILYAGGSWRSTRDVLDHTMLSRPGTRGIVVSCETGAVTSRYTRSAEDVIGIRLLTGPHRGRYGWVTSSDVHVATPPRSDALGRT